MPSRDRLIRCRSVTPEDAGALGVLEEALAGLGFTCTRLAFATGGPRIEQLANSFASALLIEAGLCFIGAGDPNLYRYVGNSPTNATDPSGLVQNEPKQIAESILQQGDAVLQMHAEPHRALGPVGRERRRSCARGGSRGSSRTGCS